MSADYRTEHFAGWHHGECVHIRTLDGDPIPADLTPELVAELADITRQWQEWRDELRKPVHRTVRVSFLTTVSFPFADGAVSRLMTEVYEAVSRLNLTVSHLAVHEVGEDGKVVPCTGPWPALVHEVPADGDLPAAPWRDVTLTR